MALYFPYGEVELLAILCLRFVGFRIPELLRDAYTCNSMLEIPRSGRLTGVRYAGMLAILCLRFLSTSSLSG